MSNGKADQEYECVAVLLLAPADCVDMAFVVSTPQVCKWNRSRFIALVITPPTSYVEIDTEEVNVLGARTAVSKFRM